MSLRTELAKDWYNVVSSKSEEEAKSLFTCDVVENFFCQEIVPHFYQPHYNKIYREADPVRLEISFVDSKLYRVMPVLVWSSDQKKTQEFQGKIPFKQERYNESIFAHNKDELWSWISELVTHEKWQIGGKI